MKSMVLRSLVMGAGLTAFLGVVSVPSASSTSNVSIGLVTPAHADESTETANLSFNVLKCFHPSGVFINGTLGVPRLDSNGRTEMQGRINFRGALSDNAYRMTYVVHIKIQDRDTMMRVTPLLDDAPFPPNPNCNLREWRRID